LRQDPDIVLVGEIRDRETLDTAMEAAMTGHLVFSTLHTNSSAETITRVYNLGAKAYQICGTFNLIMAQRLSRKICSNCSIKQDIHQDSSSDYFKFYNFAKDSLTHMDAKKLEDELRLRGISTEQWTDFSNGIISMGTGKNNE